MVILLLADGHSGSFDFHTGWSGDVTAMQVAEGHIMGTGNFVGATFNDSGSGYLHNGEAQCFAAFEVNNGVGENKGWCAWADSDGDRLFTEFCRRYSKRCEYNYWWDRKIHWMDRFRSLGLY
jgi:hypothetical protein